MCAACQNAVVIHPRIHAMATCPMMTAAREIAVRAAELSQLLADFGDRFNRLSIVRSLARQGIEVNDTGPLIDTAEYILEDVKGAAWSVKLFADVLSCEILQEDAGVLDDIAS